MYICVILKKNIYFLPEDITYIYEALRKIYFNIFEIV